MEERFIQNDSIVLRLWNMKNCGKEYYKNHEDFIKKIGSPLDKQFIQILDQQMDMFPLELSETFLDGFRLGARMMIEILGDED